MSKLNIDSKFEETFGINIETFIETFNDVITYPTIKDVCNALDITSTTLYSMKFFYEKHKRIALDRKKLKQLVKSNVNYSDEKASLMNTLISNQSTISQLKTELKEAYKNVTSSETIRSLIHNIPYEKLNVVPSWTSNLDTTSKTGIPVLFISDVHFDEVQNGKEIRNLNTYNRETAEKRLFYTVDKSIDLLMNKMNSPSYDGIVFALGGDLLSGTIHDELIETNEYPILQSVIRMSEILIQCAEKLHKTFGKVFIPCVVGNHGRLTQKKKSKNKQYDNFEFLVYNYIAKHFENNNDVTVMVPDSADVLFSIYNSKFLLTHGDCFKGGSGIAGVLTPLFIGVAKKKKYIDFDTLMVGHFHQQNFIGNSIVMNGSVKGYDSYASDMNFPFERPQQSLFIVHPTHGITYRIPVICDGYEDNSKQYTGPRVAF